MIGAILKQTAAMMVKKHLVQKEAANGLLNQERHLQAIQKESAKKKAVVKFAGMG